MSKNFSARIFIVTAVISILFTAFHVIYTSLPTSELSSWPIYDKIEDRILAFGSGISIVKSAGGPDSGPSMKTFTKQALRNDLYPRPYDGKPLRKLCKNTIWREGLFLSAGLEGGFGNLRPGLMGSVRIAIESGAGLIVPAIHPRIAFTAMGQSFDFEPEHSKQLELMFDTAHLFSTLQRDCPELILVDESDSHTARSWNLPNRTEQLDLDDKALLPAHSGHVLESPQLWRSTFDAWLNVTMTARNMPAISHTNPVRVWAMDPAFFWPAMYNGPDFYANFGRIARSPQRIREISGRVLYRLYKVVGIIETPDHIPTDGFFGVHMRTAPDAVAAGFPSYEQQRDTLLARLVAHNLSAIYVATGDQTAVERLKVDFSDIEIPVNDTHTSKIRIFQKTDFLEAEDIVSDLTWDQLGLIDVEVMLRATKFVGVSDSSWSWTLALKRHAWSRQNPYNYAVHPQAFEDEFSVVSGPPDPESIIPPTVWI